MEFLFIIAFFIVVFCFALAVRYMEYRETVALADRGLLRPKRQDTREGLRWGIVSVGVGLALCVGLYPLGWVLADGQFPLNFGPWMLLGLVPVGLGLSLVAIDVLARKENGTNETEGSLTDS